MFAGRAHDFNNQHSIHPQNHARKTQMTPDAGSGAITAKILVLVIFGLMYMYGKMQEKEQKERPEAEREAIQSRTPVAKYGAVRRLLQSNQRPQRRILNN